MMSGNGTSCAERTLRQYEWDIAEVATSFYAEAELSRGSWKGWEARELSFHCDNEAASNSTNSMNTQFDFRVESDPVGTVALCGNASMFGVEL
jgi:hypothetical protein